MEGGADVDVEDAAAVEEGVLVAAAEVDVEAAAVVDECELLADWEVDVDSIAETDECGMLVVSDEAGAEVEESLLLAT